MTDVLVIGSGLAGLIAALELARKRHSVTLLTDGRAPGGHFRGITVNGWEFDLGMVMLEQLPAPALPCNDLNDYKPQQRNDWTRFGHLASRWLRNQLPLRQVPTPTCHLEGRDVPDLLIANRLDALHQTDSSLLPWLDHNDPCHAHNKLRPGVYDTLNYAQAATLNHGRAIQERFVDPFVEKLSAKKSSDFLARQHRAAWAPLFYPETLRAAAAGQTHGLPEYHFWTTESGCVATLIRHLHQQLAAQATARIHERPIATLTLHTSGWTAGTDDGKHWSATEAVMALASSRCGALLDVPIAAPNNNVSVSLWLCTVPAEKATVVSGCQMVIDRKYALYRVSCPELQAGTDASTLRLIVEANPEILARRYPGIDANDAIRGEIADILKMNNPLDLTVHKALTAKDALQLPTAHNIDLAHQCHAALQMQAPRAHFTGTLLGYGVGSINDQIVQGLQIAASLGT